MKEIVLSHNLQQLMRIHGNISTSDLAKSVNMPQPTLHHILTGSTKNPRQKALQTLARFFSVTIQQLIGEEPLPNVIPENIKDDLKISTIPIIQWEMLKKWPPIHLNKVNLKEILMDKKVANDSFALIIQDTSIEPLFQKNTLLIFDAGKEPLDRDFVIVHLAQNDEIRFDRYFIDNNECYIKQNLKDGNAKLIKIDLHADRILGTLIEARIQY